jgi:hypothetical protein
MSKGMFKLSSNIADGYFDEANYIVTPNARRVASIIVEDFKAGIHSFTIVGAYGTGKSSFLLQLEKDLECGKDTFALINPKMLNDGGIEIINIVGDYAELAVILQEQLSFLSQKGSILDKLDRYYQQIHRDGKFLVIVIDEFGKILEHAAKNNPERELYFLQKFAEFVNVPSRNILLLTTLHQNFGAYSKELSEYQINEWTKVKGRYREVTFVEPVEQLLYLASLQKREEKVVYDNAEKLIALGRDTKFVSGIFSEEVSRALYPLDPFAAYVLTSALQRYGQNERSLFSFLASTGDDALSQFEPKEHYTYHLGLVYDYIIYNFYFYLRDTNADTMSWSSMQVAIERVESLDWESEIQKEESIKIVKAIGLMGLFGNAGFTLDSKNLAQYVREAMNITDGEVLLKKLIQHKIVRYAKYKSRLMLFDGTDIDIENEIRQAELIVDRPVDIVGDISMMLSRSIVPVKAHFYEKGTPRYFQYEVVNEPINKIPLGDIDGFVELLFSTSSDIEEKVKLFSKGCEQAIVFAVFNNTEEIVDHLYNIKKYEYILEKVVKDKEDRVARREIEQLKAYEEQMMNKAINESLFAYRSRVSWFYNGEKQQVGSFREFNALLSRVCNDVYYKAPRVNSELFNRNALSTAISTAKKKYLKALVEHSDEEEMGFPADTFPPEKTIYMALLKKTGLYDGKCFRDRPVDEDFCQLWDACESFLKSTENKARNLSELTQILTSVPFKMKQGFLDFWIPTYLFIRRQDFALYYVNSDYAFVPDITKDFFELFAKNPNAFSVKKYNGNGVKSIFFKKYREFVHLNADAAVKNSSFIETIKPFLFFYARLNEYAKHTRKFDHQTTAKFRDELAKAIDPEKAFLEDLPDALGFHKYSLQQDAFVEEFGRILQQSINELRDCYGNLLNRIEQHLVKEFGLTSDTYETYIVEIRKRLTDVKVFLLTEKQREFYNRVMTPYKNRREWYESVCYILLGRQLDSLKDEQEEKLLSDMVYMMRVCEKYADISKKINGQNEILAFSFDMVSNRGTNVRTQTFVLPNTESRKVAIMEEQIEQLLSGEDNLDVCALLAILNKKIGK